nr:hypothetical protein BaRGS_024191 [Batillaria attramentaria]
MSYTSYPRHTLPPEEESGVYNCSLPYIVPEEFQCDGIAQCLAGEDELDYNCRYTHLGCDEGWIAGDAFCLKVVFPENPISPDEAKIECLENHKADLGSLPHPGVRRLAANLMTKRGYDKLIVGLERVQNVTKGLGHLYRFLWRWTQAGMEFDGPHPHLTDSSQTCAILTFTNKLKSLDCPTSVDFDSSDDESFRELICPGHYRCYKHDICIAPAYFCDGVYHCPLKDDESLRRLRELDLSGNEIRSLSLEAQGVPVLEILRMSSCQLREISLVNLRHLKQLDLSENDLETFTIDERNLSALEVLNLSSCRLDNVTLAHLAVLQVLDLSSNNLMALSHLTLEGLHNITHLILSNNPLLGSLDAEFQAFLKNSGITSLQSLLLVNTGIREIEKDPFAGMGTHPHLDITENDISNVERNLFSSWTKLSSFRTSEIGVCCAYYSTFPDSTTGCRTETEIIFLEQCDATKLIHSENGLSAEESGCDVGWLPFESSCIRFVFPINKISASTAINECRGSFQPALENLQDMGYLHFLNLSSCGLNSVSLEDMVHLRVLDLSFNRFTNLSSIVLRDMIALIHFNISNNPLTGFLDFLMGVYMMIIGAADAHYSACGGAWTLGLILASVPLIPPEWTFYGQTGICLPLPITRRPFPGQQYAFGVFVIFNFFLFVLIGAGQLFIYYAIRSTSMATNTKRRKQDMAIARRLFLIVFTDFCCWFPIGLMGLLASQGIPISGEVNVWAAIFILPVNSAINPFLYTLGMLVERWLKRREEKLITRMLAKLHADMSSWPEDKVQELVNHGEKVLVQMTSSKRTAVPQKIETSVQQQQQQQRIAIEETQVTDVCSTTSSPEQEKRKPVS